MNFKSNNSNGNSGSYSTAPQSKNAALDSNHQQRDEPQETGEKPAPMLIGFRRVFVFDILQTDGAELPQPAKVSGEVGNYRDRLFEFVEQQGIALEFNGRIAPAQGASYGGKIVLLPGQTKAEEFATLVHEVSHKMLHRAGRLLRDADGHWVIQHDLYNQDGLTEDGIAEGFQEFAKKEELSFLSRPL